MNYTSKTTDISTLLDTARQAALEAGEAIMEVHLSGNFEVDTKADDSPLTKADKTAHAIISRSLATTGLPILSEEGSHGLFEERQSWQWYWLVDPLDGTKEFIKKNGEFTVNIALMQAQTLVAGVIYAPVLQTLYFGSKETGVFKETGNERTQLLPLPEKLSFEKILSKPDAVIAASRTHLNPETEAFISQFGNADRVTMGSSLKFMLLAENKADIYPRFGPTMEWDTAAGHAILNALNRSIYQTDLKTELVYNKRDLHNPSFVAF